MGERVRLTEALVAHLDERLKEQGRDLTKPVDVWDSELGGLVLRREASGRLYWYLRIHVQGRRSGVKLGDGSSLSVVEARKAAKIAAAKVARGDDPVAERKAQQEAAAARRAQAKRHAAAVLGTFVDGPYREWAEVHLRSHKDTLRALKTDFASWWQRPMDSITALDVERWRQGALKAGSQKSTVNRAWQRLRAVLGKANEWGLIGLPPKVKRFRLDSRGRVRYLATDERGRLIAALEAREDRRREERVRMNAWLGARHQKPLPAHGTYTDHLMPLVLTVLDTGLRRGEALGLTWSAIDFRRGVVCVRAATSKSGQSRDVPMTPAVRKVLEAWQTQHAGEDIEAYVFAGPEGARLASIGARTWDALMKAAKLKDFRFHDLRHDYASRLVTAGVDLYAVSKLLGHSDVAMSQRYAHLAPDYLQAAVRKLNSRPLVA